MVILNVIKNISNNNQNFLTLEEGIKSLKIVNSIYKSSKMKTSFDIKNIKDTILGHKNKKLYW